MWLVTYEFWSLLSSIESDVKILFTSFVLEWFFYIVLEWWFLLYRVCSPEGGAPKGVPKPQENLQVREAPIT